MTHEYIALHTEYIHHRYIEYILNLQSQDTEKKTRLKTSHKLNRE